MIKKTLPAITTMVKLLTIGLSLATPLHARPEKLSEKPGEELTVRGNGLQVTDAKVIGENEEKADIVVTPYPSDHRAVVATFSLAR